MDDLEVDIDRLVAVHEAGHCAAAAFVGRSIVYASVGPEPGDDHAGRVMPVNVASTDLEWLTALEGSPTWDPRRDLLVVKSGVLAERIWLETQGLADEHVRLLARARAGGSDGDWQHELMLSHLADERGLDRGDIHFWEGWRTLLAGPLWPVVEKFSGVLLEQGRIDGEAVKAMMPPWARMSTMEGS